MLARVEAEAPRLAAGGEGAEVEGPGRAGRGQRAVPHAGLGVTRLAAVAAVQPVLAIRAVGLHVFSQVVRPHEPLVTSGTGEPLLPRVRPQVPLQLV